MKEEKVFIKNRKNQNISVLIEEHSNSKGIAFIMHGLSGFKEQEQIEIFAAALKESNFTVIRFDTTNTLGESDGRYEDATITNYYEDLVDVIEWSSEQEWYQEPFILLGQSLGGISVSLYAEKYPDKVLGLAPISTLVSGKLSIEAHQLYRAEELENWKSSGWKEEISRSKPGVIKRLPWSHMVDRLKYDLLQDVSNLTMPVLLIFGENDTSVPHEHRLILFEALPDPKEMHIIKNSPHTFQTKEHLNELNNILLKWLGKI